MQLLCESFASLLFPACCIHCRMGLEGQLKLLCQDCLDLVDLISPEDRCPVCFNERCSCKSEGARSYSKRAFCFDYEGPQKSLLTAFKYGDKPYLAKALAGFMLLQLERLSWEPFDCITYIPQSIIRSSLRGYNQGKLLAQEMAGLLAVDCLPLLSRDAFSISQTLLTKEARKNLPDSTFTYKGPPTLASMRILLIDDVLTTGTTVEKACKVLKRYMPKELAVFCLLH